MTPVVHTDIPAKEICHKKGFLLVNLFTSSFNWLHREVDICGKKFSSQFHSLLWTFFKIFHFKHVRREVGRKVVKCVNYTKCLFALLPDVVPNAQNGTINKLKLNSNPRYRPEKVYFGHGNIYKLRSFSSFV